MSGWQALVSTNQKGLGEHRAGHLQSSGPWGQMSGLHNSPSDPSIRDLPSPLSLLACTRVPAPAQSQGEEGGRERGREEGGEKKKKGGRKEKREEGREEGKKG